MNKNYEIIDYRCEKCGCEKSYKRFIADHTEYGQCTSCGEMTYHKMLKSPNAPPVITCPYCKSTNTKKITTASKAGSVAMWGIFALGKTTKQWHCNNCKSDF